MTEQWAVIPVKGLTESKTRLANYLGANRRQLVEALLQDVLFSVSHSKVFDTIYLLSPDENVAVLANNKKVKFVLQTAFGLNRAVEQANRLATREKVDSLTVILGDIPLAEPHDLQEFLAIGEDQRRVVMAPSLKGGTNLMLSKPPGAIRPCYGRWSYSKHLRQSQLYGITSYSIANPRISFDVDTWRDLIELGRRDAQMKTNSSRVVAHLDLAPRTVNVQFERLLNSG